MSNPVPWLMRLFMPHSKCHQKTISFLEEAKAHPLSIWVLFFVVQPTE